MGSIDSGKNETAFARKSLEFEKKIILQKISQMSNLPTPSASIMKVMLLLRDEDVAMKELIAAIRQNQSLVARILKLINSGYYGLRKTIDSVERAVNLLGILKVKQLVYSASIMDMFSQNEQEEWNHAYSSSVLMSDIMEEHEIPAASNLPLTVLMHDIGKVILRRFSPKKFKMAHETALRENIPMFKSEDTIIHINHAEAGGWLLERWDMTEDIYIPVAWHHSKELPPEEFIVETALVQFTNWVDCTARGIPCYPPDRELMQEAGFDEIDNDYWINYQRTVISKIEERDDILVAEEKEPPKPKKPAPTPQTTAPLQSEIQQVSTVPQNIPQPQVEIPETGQTTMKTDTERIAKPEAAPQQAAPQQAPPQRTETEKISRTKRPQPENPSTSTQKIDKKKLKEAQEESLKSKQAAAQKQKSFFDKIIDSIVGFFKG